MKISTNSWHYRLIDLMDWWAPRNLCAYFWKVVGALLMLPVYATGVLLAALFVLAPIWNLFVDARGIQFVGGTLDVALLAAFLISLVRERRAEARWARHMRGEHEASREPSLLRQWLRAKHEKVCPTLEFERS